MLFKKITESFQTHLGIVLLNELERFKLEPHASRQREKKWDIGGLKLCSVRKQTNTQSTVYLEPPSEAESSST